MLKKTLILITFLFSNTLTFAQVGIGTTTPTETLEINGTLKINNTTKTIEATKLGGIDDNGIFREIELGTNLTIHNNVLSANFSNGNSHSFGSINLTKGTHHDVDLLIGNDPSHDVNREHTIIRIYVKEGEGDLTITGFQAGFDGQHIWIYAQNGKVDLKANETNDETPPDPPNGSLAQNVIEENDKMTMKQWAMIELVYDGLTEKWIIMNHH